MERCTQELLQKKKMDERKDTGVFSLETVTTINTLLGIPHFNGASFWKYLENSKK